MKLTGSKYRNDLPIFLYKQQILAYGQFFPAVFPVYCFRNEEMIIPKGWSIEKEEPMMNRVVNESGVFQLKDLAI